MITYMSYKLEASLEMEHKLIPIQTNLVDMHSFL